MSHTACDMSYLLCGYACRVVFFNCSRGLFPTHHDKLFAISDDILSLESVIISFDFGFRIGGRDKPSLCAVLGVETRCGMTYYKFRNRVTHKYVHTYMEYVPYSSHKT